MIYGKHYTAIDQLIAPTLLVSSINIQANNRQTIRDQLPSSLWSSDNLFTNNTLQIYTMAQASSRGNEIPDANIGEQNQSSFPDTNRAQKFYRKHYAPGFGRKVVLTQYSIHIYLHGFYVILLHSDVLLSSNHESYEIIYVLLLVFMNTLIFWWHI